MSNFENGILWTVGTGDLPKDSKSQTVPGARHKQQQLPLVDGPETKAERVQRLLAGLNMKPSKLTTAREFNYSEATKIARNTTPK